MLYTQTALHSARVQEYDKYHYDGAGFVMKSLPVRRGSVLWKYQKDFELKKSAYHYNLSNPIGIMNRLTKRITLPKNTYSLLCQYIEMINSHIPY